MGRLQTALLCEPWGAWADPRSPGVTGQELMGEALTLPYLRRGPSSPAALWNVRTVHWALGKLRHAGAPAKVLQTSGARCGKNTGCLVRRERQLNRD